jgi:hypothetical protein
VRLRVLAAEGSAHADRRALAEHLRQLIAGALGEGPSAPDPVPSGPGVRVESRA